MNTPAIDQLYLELSHLTSAKTAREIELERQLAIAGAQAGQSKDYIYVALADGQQVRCEFVHMTEGLPTPLEKCRERGPTANELKTVAARLEFGEFQAVSYF